MALFGSLFGSSSKATATQNETTAQQQTNTQNQTQKQTQTQQQATNTSQAQNTQGTTGQTGQSVTSTLDPATLALLRDQIIPQLTGSLNPAGSSVDLSAIRTDAAGLRANAGTDVQAMIKAQQDAARQDFAHTEGARIGGLQRQIGGTGNSFSQLIEQQGQIGLETNLAKIAADVTANARSQSDQELAAAAGASGNAANLGLSQAAGPLQSLLAAIQTLSQGQVVQNTSQAGVSSTASTGTGVSTTDTSSIADIISALTGTATANATSVATNAQKNNNSGGGLLANLL